MRKNNYIIPGNANKIIENIIKNRQLSVKEIAQKTGVSQKTIYRLRKGFPPLRKTNINLICLYLNECYRRG